MKQSHIIFLFIFLLFSTRATAQSHALDSLYSVTRTLKDDTTKIKSLNDLAWQMENESSYLPALNCAQSAFEIADSLLQLSNSATTHTALLKGKAKALGNEGIIYADLGNFGKAIKSLDDALAIKQELLSIAQKNGNKILVRLAKQAVAGAYTNIGIIYEKRGNPADALNFALQSLKISEEIGDSAGMGRSHNSIGLVYYDQKNYDQALLNFNQASAIQQALGDSVSIAGVYLNTGSVYKDKRDFLKALSIYTNAQEIFERVGNIYGEAQALQNLGNIYMDLENYPKAIECHHAAMKIQEETGDEEGRAFSLLDLGDVYVRMHDLVQADDFLKQAISSGKNVGSKMVIKESYGIRTRLDSMKNDFGAAMHDFRMYAAYKDSLFNDANTKKTVQEQLQYEFDRQSTADSIRNTEKEQRNKIDHQNQVKQQRIYSYAGFGAFLLMLIAAIISIRAFRNKRKTNLVISHQKAIVEEKQREILDSIHYARRIQRALLPSEKYIARKLSERNK